MSEAAKVLLYVSIVVLCCHDANNKMKHLISFVSLYIWNFNSEMLRAFATYYWSHVPLRTAVCSYNEKLYSFGESSLTQNMVNM